MTPRMAGMQRRRTIIWIRHRCDRHRKMLIISLRLHNRPTVELAMTATLMRWMAQYLRSMKMHSLLIHTCMLKVISAMCPSLPHALPLPHDP